MVIRKPISRATEARIIAQKVASEDACAMMALTLDMCTLTEMAARVARQVAKLSERKGVKLIAVTPEAR